VAVGVGPPVAALRSRQRERERERGKDRARENLSVWRSAMGGGQNQAHILRRAPPATLCRRHAAGASGLSGRFHGMLELERIGGRRAGRTKKHRPYSRASMRLAEKEKISSSASSPSSPCKAFFQGGQVGPSCAVPVCHGNALVLSLVCCSI
jgi:hypothetical protein